MGTWSFVALLSWHLYIVIIAVFLEYIRSALSGMLTLLRSRVGAMSKSLNMLLPLCALLMWHCWALNSASSLLTFSSLIFLPDMAGATAILLISQQKVVGAKRSLKTEMDQALLRLVFKQSLGFFPVLLTCSALWLDFWSHRFAYSCIYDLDECFPLCWHDITLTERLPLSILQIEAGNI